MLKQTESAHGPRIFTLADLKARDRETSASSLNKADRLIQDTLSVARENNDSLSRINCLIDSLERPNYNGIEWINEIASMSEENNRIIEEIENKLNTVLVDLDNAKTEKSKGAILDQATDSLSKLNSQGQQDFAPNESLLSKVLQMFQTGYDWVKKPFQSY